MSITLQIVAYFVAAVVYLVAAISIAKLFNRLRMPNWLCLFLASIVIGVVLGIITMSIPIGNIWYFINPLGIKLTHAMTYYARLTDYFWITLALYALFGVIINVKFVSRWSQSSDFWRR